jgi:hypothetical protein
VKLPRQAVEPLNGSAKRSSSAHAAQNEVRPHTPRKTGALMSPRPTIVLVHGAFANAGLADDNYLGRLTTTILAG